MDPSLLECEICGNGLDACACPDIDERLYTYLSSLKMIAKQKVNQQSRRLEATLAYNHFRVKQADVQVVSQEPWVGIRDSVFPKKAVPDS